MFNVGVIGLGMGKVHAKGIQKTAQKYEGKSQPNLYSLCEINKEKLEKTGEELGVTHLYTDYRELLADPLLDAVVIASPDQDHRQMAENSQRFIHDHSPPRSKARRCSPCRRRKAR